MSWAAIYKGHARDFELTLTTPPDEAQLDERPKAQLAAAREAGKACVDALGDCHVSVTASGHANPEPGSEGDTIGLSVASIPEPEPG